MSRLPCHRGPGLDRSRCRARRRCPPPGTRNDADSEKLGLKLSLQCYTFRALTFFETVDKAAGLGIKYLEMYPGQKLKPGSKVGVVAA